MTTIYLMRHSESQKPVNINNSDSLQIQNEKWTLTVNGERIAKEKSEIEELHNFDIVISSKYVRAISTAKYFTNNEIYIEEAFGERKFGINNWDELPSDFGEKQFEDHDYKIGDGESLNEVFQREEKAFEGILNKYKDKKVLIVGHSTALAVLLSKWSEVNLKGPYKYKGKEYFDGRWNFCETFKLIFDDQGELTSIKNI